MDSKQQLARIAKRRAELVARSSAQRAELSRACYVWRVPLAIADRGVAAWHVVKRHQGLVIGMGIMLAVVRPLRTLKWLKRGLMLWRFYRGAIAAAGKPR